MHRIKRFVGGAALLGALALGSLAGTPAHAAQNGRPPSGIVPSAQAPLTVRIVTHAALTSVLLVIDGTQVMPRIVASDATHYSVIYAGRLRDGKHDAYLKWQDRSGDYGYRHWEFQVGSVAVAVEPRLSADRSSIRLGESVLLSGRSFTPGATVTISLGGLNAPPHGNYAHAVVDSRGRFALRLRLAAYPDRWARAAKAVMVQARATGAAVGDLPEAVVIPLAVTA